MPWSCPACRTTILHDEIEMRPRPDTVYRCYVCRLELILNERTNKLDVTPLPPQFEREREICKEP